MIVFPTPMNSNKFIVNTCTTTLRNHITISANYNSNSNEPNLGPIFSKNLRVTLKQKIVNSYFTTILDKKCWIGMSFELVKYCSEVSSLQFEARKSIIF